MKIVVSGSSGFIGSNLMVFLSDTAKASSVIAFKSIFDLQGADILVHAAGVNRASEDFEFEAVNVDLTDKLSRYCAEKKIKFIYLSSVLAEKPSTVYGRTKLLGEVKAIDNFTEFKNIDNLSIVRLPNIFGKWCKPFYNSFVATFIHQAIHGEKLSVHNPLSEIQLVYIDDVCNYISGLINEPHMDGIYSTVQHVFENTVGGIAERVSKLWNWRCRNGENEIAFDLLDKYLYSTISSYLNPLQHQIAIQTNTDHRGSFTEFVKSGFKDQYSILTINPGSSRGGHFHHTKIERFLVLVGEVEYVFVGANEFIGDQLIQPEKKVSFVVGAKHQSVVETPAGCVHWLHNHGLETAIVSVWTNEIFDISYPDTYSRDLV